MSNHWAEYNQKHLPVKAKLTHSHPFPWPWWVGVGRPRCELRPASPALTPCLLQVSGSKAWLSSTLHSCRYL